MLRSVPSLLIGVCTKLTTQDRRGVTPPALFHLLIGQHGDGAAGNSGLITVPGVAGNELQFATMRGRLTSQLPTRECIGLPSIEGIRRRIAIAKALSSAYLPIAGVLAPPRMHEALVDESRKIGAFGHGFAYSGHRAAAVIVAHRDPLAAHLAAAGREAGAAHAQRLTGG